MSEFFIVNPLPPEQIHHEFNIYISNIYSERETRIMARRFEVEKGEEEEEEENERFAKEGGYNQTGFNFTVERNFYWDRRSRRQPETEKDGRKSVGKLGRESTLVAIRGTTFPLFLIRASSCTLCINLPPRAPHHRHPWAIDATLASNFRFLLKRVSSMTFARRSGLTQSNWTLESGLIKLCPSSSHPIQSRAEHLGWIFSIAVTGWRRVNSKKTIIVECSKQRSGLIISFLIS